MSRSDLFSLFILVLYRARIATQAAKTAVTLAPTLACAAAKGTQVTWSSLLRPLQAGESRLDCDLTRPRPVPI